MGNTAKWITAIVIAFIVAFILALVLPAQYVPVMPTTIGIIVGAAARCGLGIWKKK